MPTLLRLRPYRPSDRETCLRLFESNVPASFTAEERADFAGFLDALPGPYLVVEEDSGRAVACGGLATRDQSAVLCWGMVDALRQREGIGRVLLRVRLAQACLLPGVTRVEMNTSNETAPFFEREGLHTVRVLEHFFRPGLHRHDMVGELGPELRRTLRERLASTLAEGHQLAPGLLPG
ncbi:MAG TPA: GNAT family N-acetyltransferase [Myxococcaceae bacterium]|nr:GNAT family N-acetyltransferase [Myxococcaceae bacterium]